MLFLMIAALEGSPLSRFEALLAALSWISDFQAMAFHVYSCHSNHETWNAAELHGPPSRPRVMR